MSQSSPVSTDPQQIQALLERWCAAVRDKDLDAIMRYYAPDIVAYDAIIQLQFKGADAYRQHWAFCLGMCEGAMLFETHQLTIHADGDVAFAHWLNKCGGTDEQGEVKSSWMRATAGYRKTSDGWKAVHEHFSAPFDMATSKALFDLQP
ncbi:YybH family protein [Pseudomonas abietaniphila]|uniref:Ketosteroid isomerase homolog n=1 Tax=Pseudomonas abietaniphila TaxID=89065 RepID=A0A1G8CBQ0_9PSED|nr:nuclear transport factor 2 family protein [Pseudomonas abietaniphila]SDH42769.1 Ketosteroid isomerase homolog [Pseudomonas abietaniphila]